MKLNLYQGHVEKFADFMVKDVKTGQGFRADKLIEESVEKMIAKKKDMAADKKNHLLKIASQAESYTAPELDAAIKELKIKSPETGNELSEATPFNLMFET